MDRRRLHRLVSFLGAVLLSLEMFGLATRADTGSVVLLAAPDGADFPAWRAEILRLGIPLRHAFPPAGGIAVWEEGSAPPDHLAGLPTGTLAFSTPPEEWDAAFLDATLEGTLLRSAHRALSAKEPLEADPGLPPGPPLIDDALPGPIEPRETACTGYQLYRATSEYMLGSVSVTVILPESMGAASTENWTTTLETNVSNEIVEGLNNLSSYYPAGHVAALRPSWVYHYILGRADARAQVTVEPISGTHPIDTNPLWVNTIYNQLGYGADATMWDKGRHLNGDQRAGDGTNWSFAVFVANSANNVPGTFSDAWYGYAYQGGPFVMMTYDNATWGIGRMNEVLRHETAHIFYAADEYNTSSCWCGESIGYVAYQNLNCDKSCGSNVACVMRSNVGSVCAYTRGMIGWGDQDLDGIPDPVDIAPATLLNPYLPNPTTNTVLSYTGIASIQARPNQNYYHYMCDMNITNVSQVFWQVDGLGYTPATPGDGAFNSQLEGFQFTTPTLGVGPHLVHSFTVDTLGQSHIGSPAADYVTVTVPPPRVPSGISGMPMTVTKMAPDGSLLQLQWDVTTCAPLVDHHLVYGGGSMFPPALGGIYGTIGGSCNLGVSGNAPWFNPTNPASDPKGFFWFLILADDGVSTEGGWGFNSGGIDRTGPGPGGSSLQCGMTTKTTANACGP